MQYRSVSLTCCLLEEKKWQPLVEDTTPSISVKTARFCEGTSSSSSTSLFLQTNLGSSTRSCCSVFIRVRIQLIFQLQLATAKRVCVCVCLRVSARGEAATLLRLTTFKQNFCCDGIQDSCSIVQLVFYSVVITDYYRYYT